MKQSLKYGVAFAVLVVMLFSIGVELAFAQKYVTFTGTVVSIHKKSLSVKDSKGTTMNFVMGSKTSFDPGRMPDVGERVDVNYYLKRGNSVAHQVKIKLVQ
ncbi:MAG TPA: hypothetical protein VLK23_16455 [Thermodesulfobacteriota bacterium]|nr:hypothetical protein [Thermodesulfobacteriota bacterium]